MKNLKDELIGWLGVAGVILYYLIGIFLMIVPLVVLDFPLVVNLIILMVFVSFQFIGGLTNMVLWVWSFIVIISEPIDGWSIFYFVVFAIEVFTTFLPLVANIVSGLINLIIELFKK